MPHLAIDPSDAGDEAVGFDGAKDRSSFRVDPVNLPFPILAHPERAFGPGQSRVPAAAGRRDCGEHAPSLRIDLVDAALGDLEQMLAVERSARMSGDVESNQTCLPSNETPWTCSASGKGPYSRTISAFDVFIRPS